ncbi:MAG: hypothetical protein WBD99_02560 [Thermodesulfobacteriota bacterium]
MSNWSDVFESFYTRFILRDAVAKVTPGLGFAIGIATLFATRTEILDWFRGLPTPLWLLVLGFAWLLGLTIQSFAELPVWYLRIGSSSRCERVGLLWYWPPGLLGRDWSKVLVASRYLFAAQQYSDHAARFERFEAIKEACGITYVTLLLLSIIHAVALGITTKCVWCCPGSATRMLQFLSVFIILILLRRMHIQNMWRQYLYAHDLLGRESEVQKKVEGLKEVLAQKIDEPKQDLLIFTSLMLILLVLAYIAGVGACAIGIV